jgi:5-formyltetrahydrofolate cyclo-ligase
LKTIREKKAQLRTQFCHQFKAIPRGRQLEAAMRAALSLSPLLKPYSTVLSFSNIDTEIDTQPLNEMLADRGQLILPRVDHSSIHLFRVSDLSSQLLPSGWNILEPNPDLCEKVEVSSITFILIPAIAFDRNYHRLGRGKGYYDRLLEQIPECPAYGLGMKEQLSEELLPVEEHDKRLSGLYLF